MPYVAVVRLLIDTESKAEACDGVSAILTEQMQSIVPTSCLLDWQYEDWGGPAKVKVKDGYTPDVSHFPEHPGIYVAEK
jgi:hypothetical protein